jgi:twitching motility protein PilT
VLFRSVSSLIVDGKIQQLDSIIQNSQDEGMMSLDQSLVRLVKNGEVSQKTAYDEARDKQNFKTMIK